MTYKICHITTAHDSDDVRIFRKECVFLAKNPDFDMYLIAPGNSRHEENVNVIGIGERPTNRFKRMFFFTKKALKRAVSIDADLYHFHDPELLNVGLRLKKMGKAVVFDSHEITSEQIKIKTYIPKVLRNMISKLYFYKETKVASTIDAVIIPCLYDGHNWFNNRSKKTVFVDNLPIINNKTAPSYNFENTIYDLCTFGSLSPERGITQLLEARKIANATLVLGGDFSTKEYKTMLEKQGLLKNVNYKGHCKLEEVEKYYKISKIGMSTMLPVGQYVKSWNLSTKVYEFMSMGMPVILFKTPYVEQILKEYRFGIAVDTNSPKEIADAISYFLDNPEIAYSYGQEGRRAVVEKYNWEIEVIKIMNLYYQILGNQV